MEILELVEKVQQKDDDAFVELYKEYTRMIHSIVNSYSLEYGDYRISKDDLLQEAYIGLYDACIAFNKNKETKFSTFAYMVIKRRMLRFYRKYMGSYVNEVYSIDNVELLDHYKEIENANVNENPVHYHYQNEIEELVKKPNKRISDEDRQILLMRINNYSYNEIAKKLKVNRKRIDNRLTRLKKRYLKE